MKIFEIREYQDGGPNDRGECCGYVKAINRVDAKKRFAVGKKNAKDIVNTGFYEAREISQKDFDDRKREAQKYLSIFK